ncbi:hypothetical protein [Noviherbaspirillum sp.]|uniref:hypothetical protein n=1 Tax=Noviherbaspirillum sp. TaxID=1926288 RepID=UPI002B485523|nr:hypothetical protein [Noviherbaspirillum sp.]HJV80282.1 hypothetical protein [Noviherbaspirillum sp.]
MRASKSPKLHFAIMLMIVLVWLMAYPIARSLVPDTTFSEPFDKIYNGLNVLFTALAFGGVVSTLLFQVEESKVARREEIERSIFELFQTFTSLDFQHVKDCSFRTLLAAVKNREYAEFLASRLFVVEQLPFPVASTATLCELDEAKKNKSEEDIVHADRADRLMLDNMLNFFAMLAQRESSATVIKHCDFAYDWWRPVLWLIGQLQQERYDSSEVIRKYCKNQLIVVTLKSLDSIYGHGPLKTREEIWEYITHHPKLIAFGLDHRFQALTDCKAG